MTRDPRRDPKPGDVLSKPHVVRVVSQHQPYPGKIIQCWLKDHEGVCFGVSESNINQWRRWAAGAEVVHAAE